MAGYSSLFSRQASHLIQAILYCVERKNGFRRQILNQETCALPRSHWSSMQRLRWSLPGAVLISVFFLAGPASGRENVFTCINNNDGTSTCVSNNSGRALNCTASGSGIRTCFDPRTNQKLNCVINSDSTVSCIDPNTNEKLDCVGLGMGENACKNDNKPEPADIITDPGLFNQPPAKLNETEIPSLPEVIELPSAF